MCRENKAPQAHASSLHVVLSTAGQIHMDIIKAILKKILSSFKLIVHYAPKDSSNHQLELQVGYLNECQEDARWPLASNSKHLCVHTDEVILKDLPSKGGPTLDDS